jgi:hypothetical protein
MLSISSQVPKPKLTTVLLAAGGFLGGGILLGIIGELGVDLYNLGKTALLNQTATGTTSQGVGLSSVIAIIMGIVGLGLVIYALWITKHKKSSEILTNKNEVLPGVEFFTTRDRKVLDKLLGQIRTSGIFIGTELDIVLGMKTQLRKILEDTDAKLSFYVLDPYDKEVITQAENARLIAQGTTSRAPGNVIDFCNFQKDLDLKDTTRFQLFKYKYIPIHSVIVVNRELIQIESYLHTVEGQNRPSLIVHKDKQPLLFEEYYNSVKWIIEHSEKHDCAKST